jgi:hypothetical protein
MKIWVALATLLALILCSLAMAFMSMVTANGFMKNTDQMAISYLVCNGLSVLALSVFSGWLAYLLNKRLNLNTWISGLATVAASMLLFGVSMFAALFLIVTIFGS